MKQSEIIRLGIIAIGLLCGYWSIVNLVDVISALSESPYEKYGQGSAKFYFPRAICFFVVSFILIKNSRKISNFIDKQN
jgi:hypothetical protein